MDPVEKLLKLHETTCEDCRAVMRKKNADYCGGSGDPYANFRMSEMFGVHPAMGILLRMGDKMQRIQSFVRNGTLAVKEESVNDALSDIINYAILMKGLFADDAEK